ARSGRERAMADPAPGEGFAITRTFDAPREAVWREWTEPAAFADWFGGAEAEVPPSTVAMDVREGGEWRATKFAGPERREIQWNGHFRELVEPRRLVMTFSDQPGVEEYEIVTVELADLGDGRTEMRFTQTGGHLSAEEYERAGQGWGGF